jgi:hypothetical protein
MVLLMVLRHTVDNVFECRFEGDRIILKKHPSALRQVMKLSWEFQVSAIVVTAIYFPSDSQEDKTFRKFNTSGAI